VFELEVQMLFRRIRSPTQQSKDNCHQTGKHNQSCQDFPKQACQGWLRCGGTCQSPQTWRTSQLPLLICDAFAAERSATVWAHRCGFPQRMKQAPSVAQALRGSFVRRCGWAVRSHSSLQPRLRRSQIPRISLRVEVPLLGRCLRERPGARRLRE